MIALPLALSLSSSFTEIGAIAAFAALLGIAILSLLAFSQAREIKRLREWAGRAPERAAEMEQRVSADAAARMQRTAGPAATARPVPRKTPLVSAPVSTAVNATVAAVMPPASSSPAAAAQRAAASSVAAVPSTSEVDQEGLATAPAVAESEVAPGSMPGENPASPVATERVAGNLQKSADTESASSSTESGRHAGEDGERGEESEQVEDPAVPAPATAAARAEVAARSLPSSPAVPDHPGVAGRAPLPPSPSSPAPPGAPPSAAALAASSARVAGQSPKSPSLPPAPVAAGRRMPSRTVAESAAETPPRSRARDTTSGGGATARGVSARTPITPAGASGPKYFKPERSAARATALIVGGVIVGVLLLVLAVSALKGGGASGTKATQSSATGKTQSKASHTSVRATASKPAAMAVVVLNGTGTAGLAHHLAADLQQSGYTRASASAGVPPGTHSTTVVEYAHGHRADAQEVARALNVTQVQAIEPTTASLVGGATVVVLAGADQASLLGGGGAQSKGEPGAGATGQAGTGAAGVAGEGTAGSGQ